MKMHSLNGKLHGATILLSSEFEFSFLVHRSHRNFNSIRYELTDGGGTSKDWSELNKDGIPIGKTRTNSFTGSTSRKFIQDASFTKLREASLYYTLPKSVYGNVVLSKTWNRYE
jgi:hypothetical protein